MPLKDFSFWQNLAMPLHELSFLGKLAIPLFSHMKFEKNNNNKRKTWLDLLFELFMGGHVCVILAILRVSNTNEEIMFQTKT